MRDKIFYSTCFGFVLGVLLRSFIFVNFYLAIWVGVLAFLIILFFSLISVNKWGAIGAVFVLAFSLGVLRFHVADHSASSVFDTALDQEVSFSGEVVDEPDIRENNQKLLIEKDLDHLEEKTKILITTNFGQGFKYGDEVNVFGKLEKPENFITDQGKEFDYVNY